jgi:hypothetical protein
MQMWVSGACARHLTKPDWRFGKTKGSASIAQLVERLICNQQVGGSSPSGSSNGRLCQPNKPLLKQAYHVGSCVKVAKSCCFFGRLIAETSTVMTLVFNRVWRGG